MSFAVLIDYGCHAFTYGLATHLGDLGFPIRYFANGSLESPNLSSLSKWVCSRPNLVRSIACKRPYGKLSLHRRLRGEIAWARQCTRALEEENPSAIVASCVPLTAIMHIQAWAKRRQIPFIYWLQDIQGRAIHDLLGRKLGLAGRALGAFAYLWEQDVLERSRMVITIASGHERELPRSVRHEQRYELLENWANIEELPELPVSNEWSIRNGLDKTRNVLYSGTLGLKHELGTFLSLASAFRERSDVRVVVVSGGRAAETLAREARSHKLSNLVVLPFQPYGDVPKVLASAAVLIAPLGASAGSFCVPSKVLSYLCAGRPTVIAIDKNNPAAKILEQTGAGSVVEPGHASPFVSAVARFLDDERARIDAGRLARDYAEQTFALNAIAESFLRIISRCDISFSSDAQMLPQNKRPRAAASNG